jgi:hypothetical protein
LRQVNTNPALAGILLGVVAAEEERLLGSGAGSDGEPASDPGAEGSSGDPGAEGSSDDPGAEGSSGDPGAGGQDAPSAPPAGEAAARVAEAKRRLEGPLAALGDRCFWGWARPILGVLGAFLLLAGASLATSGRPGSPLQGAWVGGWALASMLAALVFYNVLHLATRWRAARTGLAIGRDPSREVEAAGNGFGVGRLTTWLELLGPLLLGALAGQLLVYAGQAGAAAGTGGRGVAAVALVVAGILIGVGAERRYRQPPERVGMVLLVLLLIAAG